MEANLSGHIDAQVTRDEHFAGFDDAPRSKHEVMKDVIAKSKLAKYERQKAKDADEELRMELDEELGDIRSLLFQRPEQPTEAPGAEPDKGDTYDAFVREMAYERRAKPQDRLKSAEELAEEQAKRLQEAESARLRRMRGEEDDEGEPLLDYAMDDDEKEPEEPRTMRSKFGIGEGLDHDDDDDEELPLEDDDMGEHADASEEEEVDQAVNVVDTPKEPAPSLPFTFACPSSHDAFLDLLDEHRIESSQIHTVVSRIRTLHAPNLAEENPVKLQRFLGALVDHVLYRAGQQDTKADDLRVINDLVLHIYELARAYPLRAAEHFVAKISLMQHNLMRGLARGALDPSARTWPGLSELAFLRMCVLLWPTSDKWHAVATPMHLLIAQYLAHARIRSLRDMASSLYLCSLVSSAQRESRRIVPEALNALFNVAAVLLPLHHGKSMQGRSAVKALAEEFGIPTPDFEAPHTRAFTIQSDAVPRQKMSLSCVDSCSISAQHQADLLHVCIQLMQSLAHLYQYSPAYVELFSPLLFLLEIGEAGLQDVAPSLVPCVHTATTNIRGLLERAFAARRALRLQAHRAVSIASYAPKFDQQSFDPSRATDPDTERAQAAKLRAMLKKERKGAIRELRKDAQFLAEERDQRRVAEDAAYKKKMDKIVGGIQEERSEQKQLDRAKALIKKRAGKK